MIGEPKAAGDAPAAEDTVEFELTAEQQLALWQAAGGVAGPGQGPSAPTGYDAYICRRTDRVDRVCTIAFATLVLGLTAATGWRAIGGAPSAPPVAVNPTISTTATPVPAAPAQPGAAVVQVLNPFDSTEVFELPADTSESDARTAIAALLLQRARERVRHGFDVHRVNNRHAHATASGPLDIFVTRLSSTDDRFGGIPGLSAERTAAD